MFYYCQFQTADAGHSSADDSQTDPFLKSTEDGSLLEDVEPQCIQQMTKVSNTRSILIFCHNLLSLKLHGMGELTVL